MNDNKNTAAQPLDLDKLEALARKIDNCKGALGEKGAEA